MNRDLMLSLVGKVVKIDRGGPESRVGMLLAVEGDYFVLFTKDDGVVYYKMQHVKSITLHAKGGLDKGFEGNDNVGYYQGADFKCVITNFRHSWVKVNRGGPESIEGILNEVEDDYVTIFSKEEVIQLSMFHIRNISFGAKEDENQEEQNQEAQNQEAKSSTNTKSSGNRRK